MSIVKVIKTDIREDKNGQSYKNVTFETFNQEERVVGGKKITLKTKSKISSFNAYEESYLDQKPEYGWDAEVGDHLIVSQITRTVDTYEVTGSDGETREVNTYTARIPGVENPTESQIRAAFENAGMTLVDEDGVVEHSTTTENATEGLPS